MCRTSVKSELYSQPCILQCEILQAAFYEAYSTQASWPTIRVEQWQHKNAPLFLWFFLNGHFPSTYMALVLSPSRLFQWELRLLIFLLIVICSKAIAEFCITSISVHSKCGVYCTFTMRITLLGLCEASRARHKIYTVQDGLDPFVARPGRDCAAFNPHHEVVNVAQRSPRWRALSCASDALLSWKENTVACALGHVSGWRWLS